MNTKFRWNSWEFFSHPKNSLLKEYDFTNSIPLALWSSWDLKKLNSVKPINYFITYKYLLFWISNEKNESYKFYSKYVFRV